MQSFLQALFHKYIDMILIHLTSSTFNHLLFTNAATFNMWPNSATRTLGAVTALLLWDRESLIYILLITAGSLSRWCSLHFSSVMWAVSWQIARTLQRPINFLSLSSAQLVMLWHLSCAANEWIGERMGHFLQSNSNPPHPIISM